MRKQKWRWIAGAMAGIMIASGCAGGAGSSSTTAGAGSRAEESSAAEAGTESVTEGSQAEESSASEGTEAGETAAETESAASAAAAAEVIEAPQIAAEDFPVTDGSTATLPLSWMLYRLCTGESQEEAEKAMQFTKTNNAYNRLMDGEASLVIAYEPGPDAKADYRYGDILMEPIGLDALIFICNTANPVESLTTEEIKGIYTGKIKNWSELGGEDAGIIPFQREVNSGSQTLMENLMMKGTPMADAPKEYRPSEMGELIDSVARYANTGNALGYSVYFYARNMYQRPNLRFMAVDGVMPSNETIQSGEYKYTNPFYVAIRKDEPADSNARLLFDWMTSGDGQSLVSAMDYVSITKGEKVLPDGIAREMALETGVLEGNTHRLALNGDCFDGVSGIVILDRNFQVKQRLDEFRIREDDRFTRIYGSVLPAQKPLFKSDFPGDEEPWTNPIGLFDIDRGAWAVEPSYTLCYTGCPDGEHVVYYMGEWAEYDDTGDMIPGSFDVYDENGTLLRKETYNSYETFEEMLKDTGYRMSLDYSYDEKTGESLYNFGGGHMLREKFDAEKGESISTFMEDGKVLAEASYVNIFPYMMDSLTDNIVPYKWCVLELKEFTPEPVDGRYYHDMGTYILNRDGEIVYTMKDDRYNVIGADENYCILRDYETGRFVIRGYDGRDLFSWIEPGDYGEYW